MQITVEAVGPQKQSQYGAYFGIKAGGVWYNVQGEQQDLKGKTLEVEVKETKSGKWIKIKAAPPPEVKPAAATNGHIAWEDYRQMATAAHSLALDLEPDGHDLQGESSTVVDRSSARAAILNTVMIAFSNGKIALPKEEVIPLPDEDDIPPF